MKPDLGELADIGDDCHVTKNTYDPLLLPLSSLLLYYTDRTFLPEEHTDGQDTSGAHSPLSLLQQDRCELRFLSLFSPTSGNRSAQGT